MTRMGNEGEPPFQAGDQIDWRNDGDFLTERIRSWVGDGPFQVLRVEEFNVSEGRLRSVYPLKVVDGRERVFRTADRTWIDHEPVRGWRHEAGGPSPLDSSFFRKVEDPIASVNDITS